MNEDGKDGYEEPGQMGRGAIEPFVYPGSANVLLHIIVVHGYWSLAGL
jgi:hypothetical protein